MIDVPHALVPRVIVNSRRDFRTDAAADRDQKARSLYTGERSTTRDVTKYPLIYFGSPVTRSPPLCFLLRESKDQRIKPCLSTREFRNTC